MTETALEYVKSGLSVIPIGNDKRPVVSQWKPFQSAPPHTSDLTKWWQNQDLSIAIVCGEGSGNLEGIDFDEKFNIEPKRLVDIWKELVDAECPGLVNRLVTQQTINGGNHCLYRCTIIEGNQHLARRVATTEELKARPHEKVKTLIETRGIGGYVLCYPSNGYAICNGDLRAMPTITPEEREVLLRCARALNEFVDEKKVARDRTSKSEGSRPGDQYNREGDHKALLERNGWALVNRYGDREQWARPGKSLGISATYFPETKVFYNFSSNAQGLSVNQAYSLFGLYAALETNGDYSVAAKQLAGEGYGEVEPTDSNLAKVEEHLKLRYEFRRNRIKDKIEFRRIGDPAFTEMRDVDLNSLHMDLIRNKVQIGFDAFIRLLMSDFVVEYDPIASYFEKLDEWDGVTDHIKDLADSLELANPSYRADWEICLKRWLIGYVACALDNGAVNQTAIILVGPQGIGKSRWLNRLVPEELSKYRFVGTIHPDNKDTLIYLSECILINLDELETLKKSEIGELKTTMTMPSVKLRRPYGRLSEDLIRRASFVGSINSTEFMKDATGSRRFLAFEVKSIKPASHPDMKRVLAQAVALFEQGDRWWFTEPEIALINERNKEFAVSSYEEELLLQFVPAKGLSGKEVWKTATEIANEIHCLRDDFQVNDRSVRNLGVALTKHGYKFRKTNGIKKYSIG